MDKMTKRKIIAGSAAALAVAGGGAAIAASKFQSPSETSKAIVDDAAQQLGIPSSKLSDALKKALEDQVDAAVADGRITKAEGDAMKARIEADDFPIFGHGPGMGFERHLFMPGELLSTASSYLGVSESSLQSQLESGKTLGQIADATSGKSAAGLIDALVAAEEKEHPDASESKLRELFTNLVNGTMPGPPKFFHHADFDGGPPTF
jgi:hypothetical protein